MAGAISGVQRVTPEVLAAMEEMSEVAPAHNPPYIAAMRLLAEKLPEIPLVAAFETGFHETIDDRLRYYAVPYEWAEKLHVKRWGFHGASHRYIAQRTAELLGRDDLRIISCHLGGSNSLCAIRGQQSVATTMGMSPQTGPAAQQPRRRFRSVRAAGDHAGRRARRWTKCSTRWPSKAGLLGLSGVSGDVRDLEEAAAQGQRAGASWRSTCSSPRFAGTWAACWSSWAAPTRSSSPAASARTASAFARRCARTWKSWASCSIRRRTPRPRAKPRSARPAAACRSGSCRRTKN